MGGALGSMKIWIDADACPAAVKEIVIRAAERVQVPAIFVANKPLSLRRSAWVSSVQTAQGMDVADAYIVAQSSAGDLAVTQDVPLAALLVKKGVGVLDVRGEVYSEESIDERVSMRDFMKELRDGGVVTGGPAGYGPQDRNRFASSFDRELSARVRSPR
jgi:uncharacterized protein